MLQPFGGRVARGTWSVRTLGGEIITARESRIGMGLTRTPLDYFLAVIPADQLTRMVALKSARLAAKRVSPTTAGQLLKILDVPLFFTRFEFGSCAELWSTARL